MPHKRTKQILIGLLFLVFFVPGPLCGAASEEDYPLGETPLLSKTLQLIQRNYYDPSRINPGKMFEGSLDQIQRTLPEVLAKCEEKEYCTITVHKAKKRIQYPSDSLRSLRARLKEVFQFMAKHIDPDTEKKELAYAAIEGLLTELDPHSSFLSPEAYREFQVGTEGEFGGLGIVISLKEGNLTVMSPIEDTPAWKAGIKAGDNIIQIDEESTVSMTLTDAVQRLRGPVGSKVTIKIKREGYKRPLHKTITRAVINIDAVQSKLVQSPGGKNIGFIRVKSFQGNTERDFHTQLQKLTFKKNKIKGIILDLRNNPGGLLDQAVTLSDEFLKEGTIVSTVGREEKLIKRNRAHPDGFEGDWPLIVLVNEGSASASEILAGALKNNDRAVVIGQKTFGKGSVQSVYRLPRDAALKITVAQYLTPGNQSIQSVGITPDIELLPIIVDQEHLDTVQNILRTEKDLEKHFDNGEGIPTKGKPVFTLGYLAPPPDKEEEVEYSTKLQLEKDIAAEVALHLMDVIQNNERSRMLQEATQYIESKQQEEERKFVSEFKKMGVDWTRGTKIKKGTPRAELSFQILKEKRKLNRAPAGETVTLQLKLKNIGNAPFHRLVAQSISEQFVFKNLEFTFGKVNPKETKTWSTQIEIPKASLTEEVSMTLHFREENANAPHDVDLFVPVQELKRPLFAHQYQMEEKWVEKLKQGKSVTMHVAILNRGEGKALKPVVSIKNLNGKEMFIEKGRMALDPLEPGKRNHAKLRFHIDPKWKGNEIKLELSILDSDLIVGTKQKIVLNRALAQLDPPERKLYSPPAITVTSAGGKVYKSPHLFKGEAKDDQTVRDLFIFVDDRKAYYESNVHEGHALSFHTPLELKKGNNTIAVTARDNFNLVSRQFFVLYYDPSLEKEKVAGNEENRL